MLVKVYGAAVQGIDATIVTIEVNSSRGIKFFLVGLPDSAVKESHERIISALQVNGYKFPTCQIVVNMAPADIRKEGSAYDLPLAIGILAATQIVSEEKLSRYLIIGELSLDGSLQPVKETEESVSCQSCQFGSVIEFGNEWGAKEQNEVETGT